MLSPDQKATIKGDLTALRKNIFDSQLQFRQSRIHFESANAASLSTKRLVKHDDNTSVEVMKIWGRHRSLPYKKYLALAPHESKVNGLLEKRDADKGTVRKALLAYHEYIVKIGGFKPEDWLTLSKDTNGQQNFPSHTVSSKDVYFLTTLEQESIYKSYMPDTPLSLWSEAAGYGERMGIMEVVCELTCCVTAGCSWLGKSELERTTSYLGSYA